MRNIVKKVFILSTLTLTIGSSLLMAEQVPTTSQEVNINLLNVAGKQRMLSQRIVKNYFYVGKGIRTAKAKKQLKSSLLAFNNNLNTLKNSINDEEIQNMILFIEMGKEDFSAITSETYSTDNGALALDLSESMLEGSQFIVEAIKKLSKKQASSIIDISGKQRMLSQRIAKYYISYQAGIKDKNSIDQMNQAVEEFKNSHDKLMTNKTNNAQINAQLQKVDRLWKIVYKFYLKIEKGGLPVIVYNTTDEIMKRMNSITGLYSQMYK